MNVKEIKQFASDKDISLNQIIAKEYSNITRLENGNYIINLTQDLEGTHWVAIFLKNNMVFYFDPFGMPPNRYTLNLLNRNQKSHMWINRKAIQDKDSILCGLFCLAFLSVCHPQITSTYSTPEDFLKPMDTLIEYFSGDPRENDRLVMAYLERL